MELSKDVKFRPLKTIVYPGAAGQTRDSLPITEVYQSLNIRFAGNAITTVGTDSAPENVLSLIRNLTIEGTSNNRRAAYGKFKQADFAAMYVLQQFLRNVAGVLTALPAKPGVVKAPGTPMTADLQLDFEFPHSSDPRRTWLNAAKDLQTLSAVVDWGDINDVINAVAELGAVNGQLMISGRELTDVNAKKFDYGVNTFSYQEKATGGVAATDFWFDLRRGNLLRGVLIKCYTQAPGVTFHTPTNALVNSLKFKLNRDTKFDFVNWATLREQNQIDYRMLAVPIGYAFIDFMEDGNYNKIVPTQAYTDVVLSFDVAVLANARIRVYPVEIFPAITS